MYMLFLVLDDPARLNEVLAAWEQAGAPGITILESTGLHRVLTRQEASSAFAGFGSLFGRGQANHHTLFTIIPDLTLAKPSSPLPKPFLVASTNPTPALPLPCPSPKPAAI